MIKELSKSIQRTFDKQIQLIKDICETEIEKIFFLKVIEHVMKRPDRYSFSFIFRETDTDTINGKEVTTTEVNYQMPDGFGYLCGFKINYILDQRNIEIYPQEKIKLNNPDNIFQPINYRLDFAIYKYVGNNNDILKKYCVECDGFDFHNTKDQIKRDNNERVRNLMLLNGFTTIRYLGTKIYNWQDNSVGLFLWNL